MIDFFDDIGDLVFGNKRLNSLKHFAQAKQFEYRRKVLAEKLPIEVQALDFFAGKKRKSIKGYLFKTEKTFNAVNQIFDYNYSSDLGNSITTIFLFATEELDLPLFSIKPKGGFSKLGSLFSQSEWSQINRDFDKQFAVDSPDLNFMRMMITFQLAEVMLRLQSYTLEGNGNYLALYKKSKKIDIVDMDNIYDDGMEILDIIANDHSNELV